MSRYLSEVIEWLVPFTKNLSLLRWGLMGRSGVFFFFFREKNKEFCFNYTAFKIALRHPRGK